MLQLQASYLLSKQYAWTASKLQLEAAFAQQATLLPQTPKVAAINFRP
jgi:hypothetical protein